MRATSTVGAVATIDETAVEGVGVSDWAVDVTVVDTNAIEVDEEESVVSDVAFVCVVVLASVDVEEKGVNEGHK
jgi:hypothetical protein